MIAIRFCFSSRLVSRVWGALWLQCSGACNQQRTRYKVNLAQNQKQKKGMRKTCFSFVSPLCLFFGHLIDCRLWPTGDMFRFPFALYDSTRRSPTHSLSLSSLSLSLQSSLTLKHKLQLKLVLKRSRQFYVKQNLYNALICLFISYSHRFSLLLNSEWHLSGSSSVWEIEKLVQSKQCCEDP